MAVQVNGSAGQWPGRAAGAEVRDTVLLQVDEDQAVG
jgi:hypothetical protein